MRLFTVLASSRTLHHVNYLRRSTSYTKSSDCSATTVRFGRAKYNYIDSSWKEYGSRAYHLPTTNVGNQKIDGNERTRLFTFAF